MNRNSQLLRERKVFLPKDFAFVRGVLTYLKNYNLDEKAELTGSSLKNYLEGKRREYNDIDILLPWGIYSDKDAVRCIKDLYGGEHPRIWEVIGQDESTFDKGYGGVLHVRDRFLIARKKINTKIIDLIFEAERNVRDENECIRRGIELDPLR